jgi:hypothetical protein
MFNESKKKIQIILGNLNTLNKPLKIFDKKVINFLNEVSVEIIKNKKNLKYSDLITFGFWCRKANIVRLSKNYNKSIFMIGRGSVFHITPSNVPMNFAYSLSFGLLSGNKNIIRLPSRNFIQIQLLCKIFSKILKKLKFQSLSSKICLIRYEKSDLISSKLSQSADARLIWGGDETINQFKKYPTSPRCVDLCFSNRYSISIININKISKLNDLEIRNLAIRFFNDTYLMDQQGCSSPQGIIWLGKNNLYKKKFWNFLSSIVTKNYDNDISITNKKIAILSSTAINSKINFKTNLQNFKLIKLNINRPSIEIEKIQCHFGTFIEIDIKKLAEVKNLITKKFQTITCFGINNNEIKKVIENVGLTGIDRIVPIGRAFDMGPIWDGYDIIYSLSRIVSE